MSYRKILVPIFGSVNDRPALQAAFALGKQFGAHVQALFVRLDPIRAIPYGFVGTDLSGYSAQYAIELAIKASDEAQKVAVESFNEAIANVGIELKDKPGARTDASTALKVVQGDFVEEIERESRLCDLIVFGPTNDDAGHDNIREGFEAALLSGSRPALFVPSVPAESPGQRVAIAYDGSAAAAHAVTAALPFLKRAKSVHSFEIIAAGEKSQALGDLRDYLALRGIETVEHAVDPGSKSTGEALSLAVQAQHCDLLVLGGYGHSRIREFVLGGVTRHIVQHGTPFAVLMAH
ncbi:MAG: universal stress protein [Alphaproteobacteria bacterium]|nr:universal stress protein [Alphaproteobacteria bacterium]